MYYNGSGGGMQGMYKNASAGAYTGANMTGGGSSTIEGGAMLSKDHLNESSNYLSDQANKNDPLLKSNQHIVGANTVKAKQGQYQSL